MCLLSPSPTGGYNYVGFDFANHFCEHAGFDFDLDRWYPNPEAQTHFLKHYITARAEFPSPGDAVLTAAAIVASGSEEAKAVLFDTLYRCVFESCVPACCVCGRQVCLPNNVCVLCESASRVSTRVCVCARAERRTSSPLWRTCFGVVGQSSKRATPPLTSTSSHMRARGWGDTRSTGRCSWGSDLCVCVCKCVWCGVCVEIESGCF